MNFEDTMQSKTEREILDDLTCKWNLEKKISQIQRTDWWQLRQEMGGMGSKDTNFSLIDNKSWGDNVQDGD